MRAFFAPILAGATFSDRLLACTGAAVGITLTAIVTAMAFGEGWTAILLVAPMGASAVLIFAVPASPLAQPWSVIGGNVVSALVGVGIAAMVSSPALASGLAVGGAILAMSLLRCLHPPGGAAALTAVIGGPAVTAAGWMFPVLPVGINAVILTVAGIVFHLLSRHSYPHRAVSIMAGPAVPGGGITPHPEDLDAALADLGETFDIGREDLDLLLERVRVHTAIRRADNDAGKRR
ncbi:HPP family protein [Sphingomonas sp. UV9]|uniref:HPP family protein n=1 Tax=Sphingomonas sp. UV9 TaxID=1851410 RepID=UPI000FFB6B3A|nr:HPP family protein [Sphingomonas sp. UV9]RXD07289.1 HPP family protein [Sphingomonas sp. UV9]